MLYTLTEQLELPEGIVFCNLYIMLCYYVVFCYKLYLDSIFVTCLTHKAKYEVRKDLVFVFGSDWIFEGKWLKTDGSLSKRNSW